MTARRIRAYAAAGGVVVDGDRLLVLRRPSRDEVRLPKGHLEEGETELDAAVREVGEESGYVEIEVTADLGHQRVCFDVKDDERVERDERFFLMRLTGSTTRPRNHHDRKFEPRWMTWDEAEASMTFEPEREWIRRARQAILTKGPFVK